MTSTSDKKSFKFTPKVLIRLIIFSVAIFFAFDYLIKNSGTGTTVVPSSVLGEQTIKPYSDWLYQQLPPNSRNLIENFNTNPTVVEATKKVEQLKSGLNGFPGVQIKEIQKQVIKNISDKLIESIENR